MQRSSLKILLTVIILNLSIVLPSDAQVSPHRLYTADSLFLAKRYTQSLEHYEEILRQHQYSPAMLLKMAYIYEGLNQIGSAMYCLNLYYLATDDKAVLSKIDEMATKFNLEGYATSDTDRFWSFYLNNHLWISLSLTALAILAIAAMFYSRRRLHQRPIGWAVVAAVVCMLLFAHQQYASSRSRGIISSNTVYVMDGPSAGASVVDIISDGHRVDVLGEKDVWLKIRWDEGVAFVKTNSVRKVKL